MKKIILINVLLLLSLFACSTNSNDEAPVVTITKPQNGAVIRGIMGIDFVVKAIATDDIDTVFGFNLYIKSTVETDYTFIAGLQYEYFEINSTNCSDNVGYFLNTSDYANGGYDLKIEAIDSGDNTGFAEIEVTIAN